ncbi:MAG: ribosome small subunit-dependent GTPase A, partial [Proteobacteria bacterium]|nr:ribosome small subunit-dependent GTPase A [Pseudomonadota bacterium]
CHAPEESATAESDFALAEDAWDFETHPDWFAARIVEVHKRYAFISPEKVLGEVDTRDVWLATVARRYLQSRREERNTITVGDRVLCRPTDGGDVDLGTDLPCCVIEHIAPRSSRIARRDPAVEHREHILASNIDQLLIVSSYQSPSVKCGLIDRYLVLAEEQGIRPIIVLNKEDLLRSEGEVFKSECEQEIKTYRQLGYQVFSLEVEFQNWQTPVIQDLHKELETKFTILSGHSGVGKSSLVNLFKPEIVQEVEPNSDIFYKGRHTTSYASLIKLGRGGYVIDTPGIRSFVLSDRSAVELSHGFIELRALINQCKFRECRHVDEPDCSVLRAVAEGRISERRYRSYKGMLLGDSGRQGRTRDDVTNADFSDFDDE